MYGGDTHGWQHRVVIDPSGRPGLMFGTGGPGIVDNNAVLFAYWTCNEWKVSKICDVASRYCQGTALVKGPNHYRAYVPNGQWNGGEILEFETTDGGRTWKHSRDITHKLALPRTTRRRPSRTPRRNSSSSGVRVTGAWRESSTRGAKPADCPSRSIP